MSDINEPTSELGAPKRGPGRPRKDATPPEASFEAPDAEYHPINNSQAVELAFWASVSDTQDLEEYLDRWPDGAFSRLARRRIKQSPTWVEAQGGDPDDYKSPPFRAPAIVPNTPIPVIAHGDQIPKYLLLAPFFAENDTLYPEGIVIDYLGPPNEHMLPQNEAAERFKLEQESFLDACWVVKCKHEGKPVSMRPKELADQIAAERMALDRRGVADDPDLPPTRPDLALNRRVNPAASRVGAVSQPTTRYGNQGVRPPMLGRDGGLYQRDVIPGTNLSPPVMTDLQRKVQG